MLRRQVIEKMSSIAILTAALLGAWSFAQGVNRDKEEVSVEKAPTPEEALEKYTRNLSRLAHTNPEGQAPFVGRVTDRGRLLTIASQATTQVAYLIGDGGAGKTAIVEAIAGELIGKELIQLDLLALEAGTGYRGTLEARLKAVVEGVVASKGTKILFIDEFASIMKIEGAANALKGPMARGELSLFAATTLDEYREHIEKDRALTSRAQVLKFNPMTKEEALEALRARKPTLMKKYGIVVLDQTLKQAVELAARYYGSEPLSRKTLQIVDETMSRIATQLRYGSQTARVLEDQLKVRQGELDSLKADMPFLADAEKELAEKRSSELVQEIEQTNRSLKIEKRGGSPTSVILNNAMRTLHVKEAQLHDMRRNPSPDRGTQKAVESLDAEIKQLRDKTIPDLRTQWESEVREQAKSRAITIEDVRLTVAVDRNVPLIGIGASAEQRIQTFRDSWKRNVFGQDHVFEPIERKIVAREKGLEPNTDKPLVLMFNGATGNGKTVAGGAIAEGILSNPGAHRRFNMGQYNNEGALWTLFGSAKGYKNADEGGLVTEHIRQNPFSVVQFDEMEKATRDVQNALLDALETGKMSDNFGRPIDLRNTVFVFTTNVTAEWVFDRTVLSIQEIESKYGFKPGELSPLTMDEVDRRVSDRLLQQRFSAEFLGRIDLKVNFKPVDMSTASALVERELKRQTEKVREKGIEISTKPIVIEALARMVVNSPAGGREAAASRKNIITETLLVDAFDAKNNLKKGDHLEISFEPTKDMLGGKFTIAKDGNVLKSVQVVFPVRLPVTASPSSVASPFERAMEERDATTRDKTKLLDAFGRPVKIESKPARGGK